MAKKIIESNNLGNILNVRGLYGKSKILTYNKDDWNQNVNLLEAVFLQIKVYIA